MSVERILLVAILAVVLVLLLAWGFDGCHVDKDIKNGQPAASTHLP